MENQYENQYMEILSQSNVKCIRALREIKKPKKDSYFINKLNDAKKISDDWQGRDIRYMELDNMLEKNKDKPLAIRRRENREKMKNQLL